MKKRMWPALSGRIVCLLMAVILICGLPFCAVAGEDNGKWEVDNELEGDSPEAFRKNSGVMGPVEIGASVGAEFYGASSINLQFYNVTWDKMQYISLVDFRNSNRKTSLSTGSYEFVRLSIPNSTEELAANTMYACYPRTFEVTKDGVIGENGPVSTIWVHVWYSQNMPAYGNTSFICESRETQIYANLSVYENSNNVSLHKEDEFETAVKRISMKEKSISVPLRTGECRVQKINVYDGNKEPMNVYYRAGYFHVGNNHTGVLNEQENEPYVFYAFHTKKDLPDSVWDIIKNPMYNYELKRANAMDPYSEPEDREIVLGDDGSPVFDEALQVGEIPYGEPGWAANQTEAVPTSAQAETKQMAETRPDEQTEAPTQGAGIEATKPDQSGGEDFAESLLVRLRWLGLIVFLFLVGMVFYRIVTGKGKRSDRK